jgi:hypothetical protein
MYRIGSDRPVPSVLLLSSAGLLRCAGVGSLYATLPAQTIGDIGTLNGAVAFASTADYHLVCGADNFLYKVSEGGAGEKMRESTVRCEVEIPCLSTSAVAANEHVDFSLVLSAAPLLFSSR